MLARTDETRPKRQIPAERPKGIHDIRDLPDTEFDSLWESVVVDPKLKDQLLGQAILNFTLRPKLRRARVPLHGVILLVGVPGTGKTSLARGLASRTAQSFPKHEFRYIEVEPHSLASGSLGKSQQAVSQVLGTVIAEQADGGPLIVLLDEVETLAADRSKMSLEANPVDVHRATDAVLTALDQLAAQRPGILFVATSNFPEAVDSALISRADLVVTLPLPDKQGCRAILEDTVAAVAEAFPELKELASSKGLAEAAQLCVGLDGRRIRKIVIAAIALKKDVALDPAKLTADLIVEAARQARAEAGIDGCKR
jgi:SpoVK/Ycf46/Vps4 family AAA+-type ATPase